LPLPGMWGGAGEEEDRTQARNDLKRLDVGIMHGKINHGANFDASEARLPPLYAHAFVDVDVYKSTRRAQGHSDFFHTQGIGPSIMDFDTDIHYPVERFWEFSVPGLTDVTGGGKIADGKSNSVEFFRPALGLTMKGPSRVHTNLTGGII